MQLQAMLRAEKPHRLVQIGEPSLLENLFATNVKVPRAIAEPAFPGSKKGTQLLAMAEIY
jgi:hypothetical protein